MPTQPEHVEATELSIVLARTTGQPAPSYAQLKTAMYSGRIPFTKLPNGRLAVLRDDLPVIAEKLGLRAPAAVAA